MTPPLVSVIVPTRNSAAYLEGCLASVARQSYRNVELVVVDNDSRDATKEIARRFTGKVFDRGPERSAQRNYGVQQSAGALLLVIDSDMELTERVVEACVAEHARSACKALVIPEESFGAGFWARCKKLERSFYIGVDWMEAARCFERRVFDEMGGYDERNTGTEDYDLPQRIEQAFGRAAIGRISELIRHNEQRITLLQSCRKKYYYAQRLDVYRSVAANALKLRRQSSPLGRYALFFADPAKLFGNPVVGVGMLFMKTCELAAGGLGYGKGRFLAGAQGRGPEKP